MGILGGSGGGNKGLLFFRNTGSGSILHRMDATGGTILNVPGTTTAFEGSMDDIFTSTQALPRAISTASRTASRPNSRPRHWTFGRA